MNVGLPATVVAPFDGIVKQPEGLVPIILVVFCGIDSPLRSNRVCPPWGILKAKGFYIVAKLRQRGGSSTPRQTSAYDDDIKAAFIGRTDQWNFGLVVGPFICQWTFRNVRVE